MVQSVSQQSTLPGMQPDGINAVTEAGRRVAEFFGIDGAQGPVGLFDGVSQKQQNFQQLMTEHGSPGIEAMVIALAFSETGKNGVFDMMTLRGTTAIEIAYKQIRQEKSLMHRTSEGAPARLVGTTQRSGSAALSMFSLGAEMPTLGLSTRQGQDIAALQIATLAQAYRDTLANVAIAALLVDRSNHMAFMQIRGLDNPLAANKAARELLFFLNQDYGLPAYLKGIRVERNYQPYTKARITRLLVPTGVRAALPYLAPTGHIASLGGEDAPRRAYAGYGADGEGVSPALPSDMRMYEVATEMFDGAYVNQLISSITDAGYYAFSSFNIDDGQGQQISNSIYVPNFETGALAQLKRDGDMLLRTGRWDENGNLNATHYALARNPGSAQDRLKLKHASNTYDLDPFVVLDDGKTPNSEGAYVVVDSFGTLSLDTFTEDNIRNFAGAVSNKIKTILSSSELGAFETGLRRIRNYRARGNVAQFDVNNRNEYGGPRFERDITLAEVQAHGNAALYLSLSTNQGADRRANREIDIAVDFRDAAIKLYSELVSCFPGNPFFSGLFSPSGYKPDPALDPSGFNAGLISFLSLWDRFDNGIANEARPAPRVTAAQTAAAASLYALMRDSFGAVGPFRSANAPEGFYSGLSPDVRTALESDQFVISLGTQVQAAQRAISEEERESVAEVIGQIPAGVSAQFVSSFVSGLATVYAPGNPVRAEVIRVVVPEEVDQDAVNDLLGRNTLRDLTAAEAGITRELTELQAEIEAREGDLAEGGEEIRAARDASRALQKQLANVRAAIRFLADEEAPTTPLRTNSLRETRDASSSSSQGGNDSSLLGRAISGMRSFATLATARGVPSATPGHGGSGIFATGLGQRHLTLTPEEHKQHIAPVLAGAGGARAGSYYGPNYTRNLFVTRDGFPTPNPVSFPSLFTIRKGEITNNMAKRASLADSYPLLERVAAYLFIAQPNTRQTSEAWLRCGLPLPYDTILWQLTTTLEAGTMVASRPGIGLALYGNTHVAWGALSVQKSIRAHLTAFFGATVIEDDVIVNRGAICNRYIGGGGLAVADLRNFNMQTDIEKAPLLPTIAPLGEVARIAAQGGIASFTGRTPYTLIANGTTNLSKVPQSWTGAMYATLKTNGEILNRTIANEFMQGAGSSSQMYSPLAGRRSQLIVRPNGDKYIIAGVDGLGNNVLSTAGITALASGQGVIKQPVGATVIGVVAA